MRSSFESLGAGYAASKSHAEGRTLGIVLDRAELRPLGKLPDPSHREWSQSLSQLRLLRWRNI